MAYIFLCGADMNPETIRTNRAYDGARFTGIGSIAAEHFPELSTVDGRIWGILLQNPAMTTAAGVEVADRTGKAVMARLGTGKAEMTDLQAVIAEARYWELPVAYWRRLEVS